MKVSDVDILIVPGLGNSGPEHWQSRWQARLSTARRMTHPDWDAPSRAAWVAALVDGVGHSGKPVVLVAHSIGVAAVAHAAPRLAGRVAGAFLAGMSDWNRPEVLPGLTHDFAPIPSDPLPFPSILIGSRTDPYCDLDTAGDFANAWGSLFMDAGDVGHINAESGHGPWPEGTMVFARFLAGLKA
ncbi:MAG: alpha/beta hydrolase [Rhizobiaceae bacterium]|jgi:hypothetical protein|nr:alpha/beta hydrolase [Rhizobiaceae bacterium]